jgi:hypothetical protein
VLLGVSIRSRTRYTALGGPKLHPTVETWSQRGESNPGFVRTRNV